MQESSGRADDRLALMHTPSCWQTSDHSDGQTHTSAEKCGVDVFVATANTITYGEKLRENTALEERQTIDTIFQAVGTARADS